MSPHLVIPWLAAPSWYDAKVNHNFKNKSRGLLFNYILATLSLCNLTRYRLNENCIALFIFGTTNKYFDKKIKKNKNFQIYFLLVIQRTTILIERIYSNKTCIGFKFLIVWYILLTQYYRLHTQLCIKGVLQLIPSAITYVYYVSMYM